MLSDVILEVTLHEVTPTCRRRGSRYMLDILYAHTGTMNPGICGKWSQESSRQYNWYS